MDNHQAVRESISEISPWMPWCHTGYSLNDSKTWTASCDETWAKGKEYNFVIISNNDGQPLGVCGLNHIDNENRIANVG
jgi:RimJ/RimL family protein N-acetyltransferase